jgi:hypothetical protein
MDFNEALSELIDAVADVEEHGDAIEVLQNYEGERSGETNSEWKDKYMKLESEYKKRFKERMKESATNADNEEKKDEKEEKITVEDLDFDGKTE